MLGREPQDQVLAPFLYLDCDATCLHCPNYLCIVFGHTTRGRAVNRFCCCVPIQFAPAAHAVTDIICETAKFQFVDQGPELENYYAQDDIAVNTTKQYVQEEKSDDNTNIPSKQYEASVEVEESTIHSALGSENPFLSPSTYHNQTVLVHSPIKRRRTADSTTQPYRPGPQQWHHPTYDPIRSTYRIYDPPKVFSPVSADGHTYMPEQRYVPKVVEAEYRRLADSAAAIIPSDSLLSPAIWKEEFYWPNQFTTTQCACLMRYYIEHLAPWVSHMLIRLTDYS